MRLLRQTNGRNSIMLLGREPTLCLRMEEERLQPRCLSRDWVVVNQHRRGAPEELLSIREWEDSNTYFAWSLSMMGLQSENFQFPALSCFVKRNYDGENLRCASLNSNLIFEYLMLFIMFRRLPVDLSHERICPFWKFPSRSPTLAGTTSRSALSCFLAQCRSD